MYANNIKAKVSTTLNNQHLIDNEILNKKGLHIYT